MIPDHKPIELWGLDNIAEHLNTTIYRLTYLYEQGKLPGAFATVTSIGGWPNPRPLWRADHIKVWARDRGNFR